MANTINLSPVDGAQLDRAARAADSTVESIQDAQQMLDGGDTFRAAAALREANETAQSAYLLLVGMGANPGQGAPRPVEVPLHLLDTPATRRLMDALEFAVSCAKEVDRERGWMTEDGATCGFTDTVGDVCEIVRQQVEGPKGKE